MINENRLTEGPACFGKLGSLADELREEGAEDEHRQTAEEDDDRLFGDTLPLLEDDAPDIGEGDIECHEDAPAEGEKHR